MRATVVVEMDSHRVYTHPQRDPLRLMRYYRRFLMALKRRWTGDKPRLSLADRRRSPGYSRVLRAHMKYAGYVDQYLAAKAACFLVHGEIDKFFLLGDAKPGDTAPAGIVASTETK